VALAKNNKQKTMFALGVRMKLFLRKDGEEIILVCSFFIGCRGMPIFRYSLGLYDTGRIDGCLLIENYDEVGEL